jgi:Peptidase_G2, IMC autoproteolytic cleavage domain
MTALPNTIGISDTVKQLTPPPGYEGVHTPGDSWARQGRTDADTTRIGTKEWNQVIGSIRAVINFNPYFDPAGRSPNDPMLLRDGLLSGVSLSSTSAALAVASAANAFDSMVAARLFAEGTAAVSGSTVGIYREPATSGAVEAGYMRLCWTGAALDRNAGYWLDYNKSYQVNVGDAKHHFHMYGTIRVPTGAAGGEQNGFYAHLDADPATVVTGVSIERCIPVQGNLTWQVNGTLAAGRGVMGRTRVIGASDGIITNGTGAYFEASNQTTGSGTIQNGYGVYNTVTNMDGGLIANAYGNFSIITNGASGGGITNAYGYFATVSGSGIANFYAYFSDVAAGSGQYSNYHAGSAPSYFAGDLGIGGTGVAARAAIYDAAANNRPALIVRALNSGAFTSSVLSVIGERAASASYNLITASSDGGADLKFRVAGNGLVFADGAYSGAGADFGEWTEWAIHRNASDDMRGVTVVIEDDKMRPATESDDPNEIVGVISRTACIIGNSDLEMSRHKLLYDDYGEALVDENGPVLNPEFDAAANYIRFSDRRHEWDVVGFLGRVRVRAGQPVNPKWKFQKAVSPSVSLYLICV